jgi:hypothetical protein
MSVADIAVEEDRVENAETLRQLIDMVTSIHSIKWLVSKDVAVAPVQIARRDRRCPKGEREFEVYKMKCQRRLWS